MQHSGHARSANLLRVRKPAIVLAALALAAALVIGFVQAGGTTESKPNTRLSRAEVTKPIAGAPPALAALRTRVSEIRSGGEKAFDAQLRALRGYPVERFRARGLPVTIFFDADGNEQMVHQGVYPSEKDLAEAIDRYALK